ncbi:MAG: FtsH protease activity modulator HflK [Acidithiobacillus sp.]|uniref:FtsH protease activity modulator HflK n=1 Tax=Acidithiobacillus sp. TaxID=1872118 RepID=UPI0025C5F370|nr:FtsH protease activity modulator HflK [Acidithiobacillus sp.]
MPWSDPGGNGKQSGNPNPWGRRPGQQQPSWNLAKITSELRKFAGRFGGGRGGGSQPFGRHLRWMPLWVLGGACVLWLASGVYTLDPQQEGVVLRFGAPVGVVKAGMHYHWPYPIESVAIVNLQEDRRLVLGYSGTGEQLGPGRMLTADGDVVELRYALRYRVENPEHYLFAAENPNQILALALESAMREAVAQRNFDALLKGDHSHLAETVLKATQQRIAADHIGVKLESVQILQTALPSDLDKVAKTVDKARAQAELERRDAESYAAALLPRAKTEAAAMISAAQAYRDSAVTRAKGDVARFLSLLDVYQKHPQVIAQQLYLQTMEDILSHAHKVVIGDKQGAVIQFAPPAVSTAVVPTRSVGPAAATTSRGDGAEDGAASGSGGGS